MKICILTETYAPILGGGEKQAQYLAEGLADHGMEVMVLTRRTQASHPQKEQHGPIKVIRLPPSRSARLSKWGLALTSFLALMQLRRHFDLLFVAGFRLVGAPALVACKLIKKPCLLKSDSLGELSGNYFIGGLDKFGLQPSRGFVKELLVLRNRLLLRADAFVAISSVIGREFKTHQVHPDKIHLIPNSVDLDRFSPLPPMEKQRLRKELGFEENEVVTVYTGRLVSYKGLPLLVRVWSELTRSHPRSKLVLVGSGGLDVHNCEEDLKFFVQKNALQDRVNFTGAIEAVERYLQAADIFVFPTENEAFGVALIEAMACELAVIGTYAGGLRDYLIHQQNGWAVLPGDHQGLLMALETLIQDESLRSRLGSAARKSVQERFSSELIIQKYIDLFHQTLDIHVAKHNLVSDEGISINDRSRQKPG